ncbi:MAG: alpha/beta-type small acid-soluble spore protein [Firmicutes bacterium]|nr:alpha/beta-type small acid-soluble spore protein [Bacillota bacterium]
MARGSGSKNQKVIPQAAKALDQFKYEVASELGINSEYQTGYWGNISSRECGAVGGHMVRRMIAAAEQSLAGQTGNFQGFRSTGTGFPLEPDAQPNNTGQY